ncbi:MAG: DUF1624 domain-containing protein [Planctomycetales bacterium]|nr:DUF1624 domain-containing protein [Planctomycetales bacterium]
MSHANDGFNTGKRFVSIDALRGFDMFWILGASGLAKAFALNTENRYAQILSDQLTHVPWAGFHFYDLIFPLFVFLMGVSTVFSLDNMVDQKGMRPAFWRIIRRSIVLYILGLLYHGGLSRDGGPEMFRYVGVLHRIAICYLFGAILYLSFRWKGLLFITVLLLGGYWAALSFIEVPGHGAPNFNEGTNLANYIDAQYLPGYKWDGDWDPEGLLSTLPAIATGLLGIFCGLILRNYELSAGVRIGSLLLIGGLCLAAGYGWHVAPQLTCPVIKKLWTPSFVLYAGGWSFLTVAVCHAIMDVGKFSIWARPFVWIGMNPITLYMASNLIGGYGNIVRRLVHSYVFEMPTVNGPLLMAVLQALVPILFAWILYKNKCFLRV